MWTAITWTHVNGYLHFYALPQCIFFASSFWFFIYIYFGRNTVRWPPIVCVASFPYDHVLFLIFHTNLNYIIWNCVDCTLPFMLKEMLIFYSHISLMTHRVLESYRNNMGILHICSQKDRQCTLSVITNMPMTS